MRLVRTDHHKLLQQQRTRIIRTRKGIYGWDAWSRPELHVARLRKMLVDHYVSLILAGEVSPPAGAAGQGFPFS